MKSLAAFTFPRCLSNWIISVSENDAEKDRADLEQMLLLSAEIMGVKLNPLPSTVNLSTDLMSILTGYVAIGRERVEKYDSPLIGQAYNLGLFAEIIRTAILGMQEEKDETVKAQKVAVLKDNLEKAVTTAKAMKLSKSCQSKLSALNASCKVAVSTEQFIQSEKRLYEWQSLVIDALPKMK